MTTLPLFNANMNEIPTRNKTFCFVANSIVIIGAFVCNKTASGREGRKEWFVDVRSESRMTTNNSM